MFDGVPEQFHQFITPRNSSLPIHLPFPLHASATVTSTTPNNNINTFPTFDPYNPPSHHHHHHHHQLPLTPSQLLQQSLHHKDIIEEKEENTSSFAIHERDQPPQLNTIDPWTNDEVLALLRIRSSMESWFPEFTWEHVSRKLAEVGYKRSAEKCKEKFEEETRYFTNINENNNNNNYKNNYRFISELEELYQAGTEKTPSEGQQDKSMDHAITEEDSRNDVVSVTKKNDDDDVVVVVEGKTNKEKKRKRGENRFEVFKGFCESVVQKMMAQQEEMHSKLLQDMLKRDEEKFNREEAWKKQEMEKMNKELEIMAREQAIACDRHANIIQFLKNLSTLGGANRNNKFKVNPNPSPAAEIIDKQKPSSVVLLPENQNPSSTLAKEDTLQILPPNTIINPSSSLNSQNDNSVLETSSISNNRDDIGRRWPKDEVLALINLRCTSLSNNNEEKEGNNNKAPLWERISQGMLELGYKRSAKRCKEKWENINKYFRKTKDANRKRSIDSRTCPYFHLLSNLYKQGKLVAQQSEKPEGELNAPAENLEQQTQAETSQVGPAAGFTVQQQQQQVHDGGEKNLVQVPSLDFDQF